MQPAGSDPSFTVVEDDTLTPVAATAFAHASSVVMSASQVPEVNMEEELTCGLMFLSVLFHFERNQKKSYCVALKFRLTALRLLNCF